MANGDIIKLGTFWLNNVKQKRPLYPYNGTPTGAPQADDIPNYSSGNVEIRDTDSDDAYKIQWVEVTVDGKKLLIADRCILHACPWDTLNSQNLIFGKEITIDGQRYKVRSLTGGSNFRTGTDDYSGGQPTNNEWDRIICNEGNFPGLPTPNSTDLDTTMNATDFNGSHNNLWHWYGIRTWCQETYTGGSASRAFRGYNSARYWYCYTASNTNAYYGFRPCLEVLNTAPLISDTDRNLGSLAAPPIVPYSVAEGDGENFSIFEVLNSTTIRSLTNQSDGDFSIDLSPYWTGLAMGNHTLKVTATDPQGASTTRTWTFTKINAAPAAPVFDDLVNQMRLPASGYIGFIPGADTEGDTQAIKLQFATDENFSAGLIEFSAGIQKFDGNDWEDVSTITNDNAGIRHRIPYSDIPLNETRYLRFVTTDGNASRNSEVIMVSMGNILEIITKPENRDLRPLSVFPIVESVVDPRATVTVYVCNNANDASPTWEDCTAEYQQGKTYTFQNLVKTAEQWALAMRIVIVANDATEAIEVSAAGMGVN